MSNTPIITEFASVEVPKFVEKKSQNIVYFGADNLYPFELIDLYNDSSTHNAIVNGKVGYIVGNGLDSEDLNAKKWLASANISEDWTSLMKRLSLDYELFNGYAIEVIRTAAGNQYQHIDFANIRLGLDGSIQYADNWMTANNTRNSRPNIQYLERYAPSNPEQKRGVIYHVDYRPNLKHYPLPVYVGSLAEIKTDVQIGDYWLSEISNGFAGGTLIQHNNGVPETTDEKKSFEKSFKDKFGGATGSKIVHLFAPDKDHSSEISNLNGNDLHERYVNMSERIKESIFIGHRVTNPILFGVKEAGQMGARNELDLAYEIFTNTYIQERKNTLLNTIRKLALYDISVTDIEIVPLKPIDTIDLTSDIILANLNRSEIRELIRNQSGLDLEEEVEPLEQPVEATTAMCSHFAEEENISHLFNDIGEHASGYEVVNSVNISFGMDGSPMEFATEEETSTLQEVLNAMLNNPLLTAAGLAELLELGFDELVGVIDVLKTSELITIQGSVINLTDKGNKIAEAIKIPDIVVKYAYELRDDAPPLKAGGKSREFCSDMMNKNKLYSKQEIEVLRNNMKSSNIADVADVWLSRGGWYRKEGSTTSIPFCRHIWKQVLVRKK